MAEKVVIGNAELWHGDCREVQPLLHALRDLVDVMTGRMEGETVALHNALAALMKADGAA